jgi:hypothetical protein
MSRPVGTKNKTAQELKREADQLARLAKAKLQVEKLKAKQASKK